MQAKADNPDLAGIPQLPTPLRHDVQLYVQVYDVLYDMISGGQLKPGDLIPGECALAQHFGVSRGTVRQAIQYLEEDNRPQVSLDVDFENGMGISVGRLRKDTVYDYKFVGLSHNTVRGAAGGAVLCAELLTAQGYIR